MLRHKYLKLIIACLAFIIVQSKNINRKDDRPNWPLSRGKGVNKAVINMYYECHCKTCRIFDTVELAPTVEKIGEYLELNLFPYGRSQTIEKGNGEYEFECRHGPEECYGDRLHLCAMDFFGNMTKAVKFNSCMMEFTHQGKGSDDVAADKCGKAQSINVEEIKECAKSRKGAELLKKAGDETKKIRMVRAPFVMLNGQKYDPLNADLFNDVCDTFDIRPSECPTEF